MTLENELSKKKNAGYLMRFIGNSKKKITLKLTAADGDANPPGSTKLSSNHA